MTAIDDRVSTTEAVIKELKRKLAEETANLSAYKQEAKARGLGTCKAVRYKS